MAVIADSRRKVPRRARRLVGLVAAALLLGALLFVALRVRPWADSVMSAAVTISADGAPSSAVYEKQTLFAAARRRPAVIRFDVDLARWAGRAIRFDVAGRIAPRDPSKESAEGRVACAAELVSPAGVVPLEFVGWENDGATGMGFHLGRLGCPSFVVPGPRDRAFFYTTEGPLWHAVRVPEKARLRIWLMPAPDAQPPDTPQPLLPSRGPVQTSLPQRAGEPRERRPDIFIYVVDALRADHLGCYGYPQGTSPAIDAFAANATLCRHAYTAATWTRPSTATLLSGRYPAVHGAVSQAPETPLPQWPVLLPEALQAAGYRTHFISANRFLSEPFGFNQGFDSFLCKSAYKSDLELLKADWANARVAEALAAEKPENPVFMYLHIMEPHLPYKAEPESFRFFDRIFPHYGEPSWPRLLDVGGWLKPDMAGDELGHLMDWYDACIFEADGAFAGFLDLLRKTGRFQDSLIILTADHGEAFLEHETLDHGHTLSVEEMRVPLIVRFPGGRFSNVPVNQRVSLIDVFPTALAIAGVPPPPGPPLSGLDLAAIASDPSSSCSRPIFAELSRYGDNRLDLVAVIDEDGYKTVLDLSAVPGLLVSELAVGLWDTRADPGERTDLTRELPVRAAYHEQLIAQWLRSQLHARSLAPSEAPPPAELTDDLRREMKALGYLE